MVNLLQWIVIIIIIIYQIIFLPLEIPTNLTLTNVNDILYTVPLYFGS